VRYAICILIAGSLALPPSGLIERMLVTPASAQTNPASSKNDTGPFKVEALPKVLQNRVDNQRKMLEAAGIDKPGQGKKGVLNAWKIWTPETGPVKVCFFTGSRALRARIAKIALQWKEAAPGVPLDFGDPANPRSCSASEVSHIRVGFAYSGYWSLVGQDSLRQSLQTEQSMNFENFDTNPPDDKEFQSTVLHEFGHALGLHHEHQNPLGNCIAEFNWPKVYSYLAGPPNSWSKDETDAQMQRLNEAGLYATAFDKASIMLYTFPASYFKAGEKSSCYSPPNITLSAGDTALMAELYPTDPNVRLELQDKINKYMNEQVAKSGALADTKSAILLALSKYMPEVKH
jgi:hypothetical protein